MADHTQPKAPNNALQLAAFHGTPEGFDTQTLHMQIHIFDEAIIRVTYENGEAVAAHEVAPADVAAALSGLPLSGALLPEHCVTYGRKSGHEYLAVYVPPHRRPVSTQIGGETETHEIPVPGLIFAGYRKNYYVFAVKEGRPGEFTMQQPLYRAPFPNVNSSGRICLGNADFPQCTADTIWDAVDAFFSSYFNNHNTGNKSQTYEESIIAAWHAYADRDEWPTGDLVKHNGYTIYSIVNVNI